MSLFVENTRKKLHSNLVTVLFLVLESKGLHKYNTTRKKNGYTLSSFRSMKAAHGNTL